MRLFRPLAAGLLLSAALPVSSIHAQVAPATLVAKVDIPYQRFTLPNGLRVIVHTDRKAPIVAVSVWYGVGSKNEPAGRWGFAHLFEHLMFNGSENAPGDYFEPLTQVGATDFNGTTWYDRTNYFQTVPTSALEVALFMESDRMGHLLGAVSQEKLDNQRSVVQNEKRQGDNQPYGLVDEAQVKALYPPDHPYGHETIGLMADLDKASLGDVHDWFIDHYGPNNAVLVLAGDIDVRTAKKLVTKWFGAIPAGKAVPAVNAPVPTLAAPKTLIMKDRVAMTRLYRWWAIPGINDPDFAPLAVGAKVLGGLASSRLDTVLVRQEQLAVATSVEASGFAQAGVFSIQVDVKPGVDPATVNKRIDELLASYLKDGPTTDEVLRVATTDVAARINALEQVGGFGGKATTLAEGELYSGNPEQYKKEMADVAAATPQSVATPLRKWLSRPVAALTVVPGERDAYVESALIDGPQPTGKATDLPSPPPVKKQASFKEKVDRSKLPAVGTVPNVDFPTVETGTLSNGIKVHFARRDAVPALRLSVVFNAGKAADAPTKPGTQALTLAMMTERTRTRDSLQIAQDKERLGAEISAGSTQDSTSLSLFALTPNLAPSLDLLADIVKHPAFGPPDVLERLRGQQLAAIAAEQTNPSMVASNALMRDLYGPTHPYGIGASGSGDAAAVKTLNRDDLLSYYTRWLRPDNAEIFAVGATSLKDLLPMLEERFGTWQKPTAPRGTKSFDVPLPAPQPRVVVIDRPGSPQSTIYGGQLIAAKGSDDMIDLIAAVDILGGNFLSRLNMDIRETKGWAYGVRSAIVRNEERAAYIVVAPVQANRTGDAIAAMQEQSRAFLTTKGVSAEERTRTVNQQMREMPGSYEQSDDVLSQMITDWQRGRPANYVETLAARYNAQTAQGMDAAARALLDPGRMTWVVVGDKAKILPQLQKLGMSVVVKEATSVAP